MDDFSAWIGTTETSLDFVSPLPLKSLASLLDHGSPPWLPGELPPLAHWFYFLPQVRQSEIDIDGHPKRGGFLPPVPLPRRMWAGGRINLLAPVPIGSSIERRSTILAINQKKGASGDLVFVVVRHEFFADGVQCILEEQDIVYREGRKPGGSGSPSLPQQPAKIPTADVIRPMVVNPVHLFRFSALTSNSHRIHYDRDYARDIEGYGGLVVHGPLLATLLADHFLRAAPDRRVTRFAFRAQQPLLDIEPFDLCLDWIKDGASLFVRNPLGEVKMHAELSAS
jgi:3-methylfumaryl-CoA hydratase